MGSQPRISCILGSWRLTIWCRPGFLNVLCRASERVVERLNHAEIQSLVLQMMLIPNNLTIHLLGEVVAHVLSNPPA
jgi:hypothetical protein